MELEFTVRVEVERQQGKFAGRDELEEQLRDALESADPGQLEGENGGEYEVTLWEVEAQERRRSRRRG